MKGAGARAGADGAQYSGTKRRGITFIAIGVLTSCAHLAYAQSAAAPAADAQLVYAQDGRERATPDTTLSFAVLWQRACGAAPAPSAGEGILYGWVLRATIVAPGGPATIDVAWQGTRSGAGQRRDTTQRRRVRADRGGHYAVCGIPVQQMVTLSVTGDGVASIPVSFQLGTSRIARRDITLPSAVALDEISADTASRARARGRGAAILAGAVRDSTDRPLDGAIVTLSGESGEWRSNPDGEFAARGIPSGTRVISIKALGFAPERRLVDLTEHDSAYLSVSMSRLITTLTAVQIQERKHFDARRDDLAFRRRIGFGYWVDSLDIARLPALWDAFNMPGVHVRVSQGQWSIFMMGAYHLASKGGSGLALTCTPTVWIDGEKQAPPVFDVLNDIAKDEVGVIEVYTSAAGAPLQYSGSNTNCGILLVWTKFYVGP